MVHQSLYRRYRSKNFAEIKGQPHVTSALQTAVAESRHGHAYLFSGPRGTGKTSTARVLAKALNCEDVKAGEPCTVCDSCISIDEGRSFDLHELDAASNNKVDDIRDLIAKVQLGSPGRTKVYILDEVHMLTTGAENALLKTLEEPPDHVVFVLATTEPHKVVPTIRSRTQHFEFHLLPAVDLAAHVEFVVEDAGLDVDAAAIEYALAQGGGSARDTLSALDLVSAAGGVPAASDGGAALVRAVGAGDPALAIQLIQEALVNGLQPRIIGEQMLNTIRDAFLCSMGASLDHLADTARTQTEELAAELTPATLTRSMELIGQALIEIRQAPDPRVPLEVAVLRLARRDGDDLAGLLQRIEALESGANGSPAAVSRTASAPVAQVSAAPPASEPVPLPPAATPTTASPHATTPPAAATPGTATPTAPSGSKSETTSRRPRSPRSAAQAEKASTSKPTNTTTTDLTDDSEAGTAEATPPTEQASPPDSSAAPRSNTNEGSAPQPDQPAPDDATPDEATASNGVPADSAPATPSATTPSPANSKNDAPIETQSAARPVGGITVASASDAVEKRLDGISQKARVRFKGGKVNRVEGATVYFAVPNKIHCDRCIEVKGDVEKALSDHFGTPVSVEVVVDGEALSSTVMDRAKPAPAPKETAEANQDIGPVSELEDADQGSTTGVDRLTKAFPGSKVIEPQRSE